jgi:hypothetical protein
VGWVEDVEESGVPIWEELRSLMKTKDVSLCRFQRLSLVKWVLIGKRFTRRERH